MTDNEIVGLVFGIWGFVSIMACGIIREAEGHWDFDWPMAVFWPLAAIFFIGFGALWSLTWIGRGPALLVKWFMSRPKLPRAQVKQ